MNDPHAVQRAVNKLECLDTLSEKGIAVPEYTVYPAEANAWLEQGHSVIERHIMNSHSGRGIVLTTPEEEEVGDAHFYTKYVGARREYRCHIFNGQLIFLQQKKRRNGTEQNDTIRNHRGGWVYAVEDITPLSEAAVHDAILAVNAMGLVFGAVDVITRRDSHYILEINTSPGLEGRTVGLYTNAIQAYLR
jgi:glutathione synthase/RimK-type ligase-like ATP-grasp enzyme